MGRRWRKGDKDGTEVEFCFQEVMYMYIHLYLMQNLKNGFEARRGKMISMLRVLGHWMEFVSKCLQSQ